VDWYDWLLFLHVAAAFAAVAGLVFLLVLLAATWRTAHAVEAKPLLRLSGVARRLWDVGGLGTLVFGIWLAIYLDGYELWDGWIVAAIVLWAVASGAGARVGSGYRRALRAESGETDDLTGLLRTERSLALHGLMTAAVAALLVVMIYKPGA